MPRVTSVAWHVQAFSGSAARPDGIAAMQYRVAAQPGAHESSRAPWLPALTIEGYTLPPGAAVQR
ncbi:MAG: hypothetical protein RMJ48_10765 [Roseiflexaceae bacterium]|nr:hypothetical protein [Roseiflexaceae bacterium]